jgi:hypothetical protein
MPMKDEMSHDQLEQIAAEIGVTPESLRKAEEDWEAEELDKSDRRAYIAARRRGFLKHFMVYVSANLFLFLLAVSSHGDLVALFFASVMGWGIGLGVHGAFALQTHGEDFETRFTRWRIRRRAHQLAEQELIKMMPRPR